MRVPFLFDSYLIPEVSRRIAQILCSDVLSRPKFEFLRTIHF